MFHSCTNHIEAHYHFMHEQVLSREVELRYIRTDRQVSDIFTKPLGSHKLQSFSKMLGLQHLDVPHLRGRAGGKNNSCDDEPELESVEGKRRDDKTNQR